MKAFRNCTISAIAIVFATQGNANANDEFVRGLLGLGAAIIINGAQQQQQQQQRPYRNGPAARQGNSRDAELIAARMEIQRRLNLLGFEAGHPDGVYGAQTRDAIARFQSSIGQQPTGKISQSDIAILYRQTDTPANTGDYNSPAGTAAANPGQFPSVDTPPANSQNASFPGLRAPTAATGSFPALGGGQNAAPSAPAQSSFPTLGTPQATSTTTSAFAPLSAPPKQDGVNPPLAVAPASSPAASSFPALGGAAAPDTSATAMPGLTTTEAKTDEDATLALEVAHLPFKTLEAQPAVAGVKLGADLPEMRRHLSTDGGYSSCVNTSVGADCTRQTDSLTDTVRLWQNKTGTIYGVTRLIEFKSPVPTDVIKGQFSQTYADIVSSNPSTISSKASCDVSAISLESVQNQLDAVQGIEDDGVAEIGQNVLATATSCPVGYHIAFNEADNHISSARIAFFDSTSVLRQEKRNRITRENAETERRKQEEALKKQNAEQVTTDLKL